MPKMSLDPHQAGAVRYIKLGEGGEWADECINRAFVRIGFDSEQAGVFDACTAGRWDDVREHWLSKSSPATATSYVNQLKAFYSDSGTTLWFTIHNYRLYWALLNPTESPARDERSSFRKCAGWSCLDTNGEPISKAKLAGFIRAKESFPGTSCEVHDVEREYLLNRIRGRKLPQVLGAEGALDALRSRCLELIRLLDWRDFEMLGGLIFETSGWRRVSMLGGNQKTTDIEMELPTTNERAFVQIKSSTDQLELNKYESEFMKLRPDFRWMFYVFHTGEVATQNPQVRLVGPGTLEKMVVSVGLTEWIIDKVS